HLFSHRSTNPAFKNPHRCPPNGYSRRPPSPPSWYCTSSNCTACNIWLHAVDDIRCKPFVIDAISQYEDSPCPHLLNRCKPFVVDTIGQHEDSLCPHSLNRCKHLSLTSSVNTKIHCVPTYSTCASPLSLTSSVNTKIHCVPPTTIERPN